MENPRIHVIYSLKTEVTRIRNSFKKIDWYKEKGYWNKIKLPESLKGIESFEKITEKDILDTVKSEYSEEEYKQFTEGVRTSWDNVGKKYDLWKILSALKLQSEYTIQLTKYGVGGSYSMPNRIVVNIHMKKSGPVENTILHEMVHLSIQELIDKYEISHWHKERLVELIILKTLPEMAHEQDLPEEAYDIDEVFDKFYPDMEAVIKNL
tara:strand:+ start:2814 stop:3440 length:627 start_codon:yes stop_codon:yes gene_type:complete